MQFYLKISQNLDENFLKNERGDIEVTWNIQLFLDNRRGFIDSSRWD